VAANNIVFIFPGQGSQYRGMGSDLVAEFPVAAETFDEASDVLGMDMRTLCFEDPREEIQLTKFTQPALLTHEIACLRAFNSLTDAAVSAQLVGGHSLGEYSALVAAGALGFSDALRLVAKRGELMSRFGTGGMVATTLDFDTARVLADRHYCGIGGCNLPDQTVIAGNDDDLEAMMTDLKDNFPGKRAIRLQTEGAFHTYLMVEAARHFRSSLDGVGFSAMHCPVLSNYTGTIYEPDVQAVRSSLFFQLFFPVRWYACLETAIARGADTFVEFGGGIGKSPEPESRRPNLEGIVKKALKFTEHDAQYVPAINVATIRGAAESLQHSQ
jgi:[acyl-carrier-protein] S-malonyltransferase